jgi:predicted amidohydrolase YtcJ
MAVLLGLRRTASGRVVGPEQRVSVHDALRAVTIEAAYSWRMKHELGSIAPGKSANFTVLAEDPYGVDPSRLDDIAILGTVYEGRGFPAVSSQSEGTMPSSGMAATTSTVRIFGLTSTNVRDTRELRG